MTALTDDGDPRVRVLERKVARLERIEIEMAAFLGGPPRDFFMGSVDSLLHAMEEPFPEEEDS